MRATGAVPAVHVGVPPARDHMFVVTASRGKHAAVVIARTDRKTCLQIPGLLVELSIAGP